MADQHSSLVVLGNTSAFQLPEVPGRAIAQRGFQNLEVQTPYLSIDEADEILKGHRTQEKEPEPDSEGSKSDQPAAPDQKGQPTEQGSNPSEGETTWASS
jgi:hypothetical protein